MESGAVGLLIDKESKVAARSINFSLDGFDRFMGLANTNAEEFASG